MSSNFFTSEASSEGDLDKIADQISDAIIDELLKNNFLSKGAIDTILSNGIISINGQINSLADVDYKEVTKGVLKQLGLTDPEYPFNSESTAIISNVANYKLDLFQSMNILPPDNHQPRGGVGYGYAASENPYYLPTPQIIAKALIRELSEIKSENKMTYLLPDAKATVTVKYNDRFNRPEQIYSIALTTQQIIMEKQSPEEIASQIKKEVTDILLPRVKSKLPQEFQELFRQNIIINVNPTSENTGISGRQESIEAYGGKCPFRAISGKDASNLNKTASYAARYIAKNMIASGIADEVYLQLVYAKDIPEPTIIYVNTNGTAHVRETEQEIANKIPEIFDLRPIPIMRKFNLTKPIFLETAKRGHFGEKPEIKDITLYQNSKLTYSEKAEFFSWEKLYKVDEIKEAFKFK